MNKTSNAKNKILLFSLACFMPFFSIANEHPTLQTLENSDKYCIRNIDLNKDNILDKVVSSKKYEGNELYFFIKEGAVFHYKLQSTNFSVDGGNIIKNIHPENQHNEILSISTYFPDRGHLTAQHFIAFKDKDWFLTRTVYETTHWQNTPSKTYTCTVKQNIKLHHLTNGGSGWNQFKHFPKIDDNPACKSNP